MSSGGSESDGASASGLTQSKWSQTHELPLAPPVRVHSFTPGTMLAARYRVVALLGTGGMGEVYRADDTKLGQAVALKFLHGVLSPERLQKLYAEVRIGRQVSHPNVCRLYDVVEYAGETFLAMEYVDGEDLQTLLSRIGRLPPDKALEIARDLCAGLAAAHDRGVVHRDLKPANIMIDGRGRARLTDFGLALADESQQRDGFAGTPAYMSPEQFARREASPRSDLFALGLVLYEMFTGQRFFDAKNLDELQAQHAEPRPQRLQSASRLLEPAVAAGILECLAEDPAARPSSARALLARLPGGDPLEAAIAAGETPSPEMVAAAGRVGSLSPQLAWACLLAIWCAYGVGAWLSGRTTLLGKAPLPKPPQVLVERSREILERLGQNQMGDWAYSFEVDAMFLDHLRRDLPEGARWENLADARPGPFSFFYRQSPGRLVAANRDGVVTRDDPPSDVPGMAEVVLDPRGRLLSFVAVPPQVEALSVAPEPDWGALFREADVERAAWQPATPSWAAPVDSDRKAAWTGQYSASSGPTRIEAAAYHGRPVWFAVLPAWADSRRGAGAREPVSPTPFTEAGLLALAVALPTGGFLLARRNLRKGRGDRKGALRVGGFVFACYGLARLFRADHTTHPSDEVWLLIKIVAYPALWGGFAWLTYMALEPYARRRWPHVLISWKRLLSGQWRDPLVGRDVLIGMLVGAIGFLITRAPVLLGPALGLDVAPELFIYGSTLTSLRQVLFRLFVNQFSAVQYALVFLFLLVLLRLLLMRTWLAALVWCNLVGVPFVRSNPAVDWTIGMIWAGAMLFVLMQVGLLAYATLLFWTYTTVEVPAPIDLRAWYALSGWPVLCVLLALSIYGFYVSLAGKPIFGRALLEE